MPLIATSGVAPEWYTLEGYEEDSKPPKFQLRPLTPPEREQVMDWYGTDFVVPIRNWDRLLKMGVLGWENFTDEHGKDIPFEAQNFKRIPEPARMELAGRLMYLCRLQDEDAKN